MAKNSSPANTLDAYIRVSRVNARSGASFMSPDQQREEIERWAKANNVTIGEWHTDLDQSGGKASRPGLDALQGRIKSGLTGGMIVAKLDRASRRLSDGMVLIKSITDGGARFVSVSPHCDPQDKNGRLMLGIFLALAEWELEGRTENWADVTERVNARGVHQGNVIGYTRTNGNPLEVDETIKPHIVKAFEMRASNASWATIGKYLDQHVKPARAAKWSINSVTSLIRNRAYLGEARQGDLVNVNAHPAIITHDLFAAANAIKGSSHAKAADHLLSGLCRCQGCRYRMMGNTTKSAYGTYRNYRCRRNHGAGVCESPASANSEAIEAYVVAEAFKAHDVLVQSTHKSLDIDALNAAVSAAETEAGAFVANVPATSEWFAAGMAQREEAVKEARQARENALAMYAPEGVSLSSKLSEDWDSLSIEDQRAALKALIEYIVVAKDRSVQIIWRGQGKALGTVPNTGKGQNGDEATGIEPFGWPILTSEGGEPHKL